MMVLFPIHVPRKFSRSRNPREQEKVRRLNERAEACEAYINQKFAASGEPVHVFIYGSIANDLGLSTDEVREVLYAVDAGHNGLTVSRPSKPKSL